MNDVAKLSGVTQATVSNVINRTANVSAETEANVLSAIDELGFIPNAMARGLKMKRTNTVGIVIPDVESGYYSVLVNQLSKLFRDKGYMVFLCNTFYDGETERELVKALIEFNVEGIVVCYGMFNQSAYADIKRYRVPLVMVDVRLDGECADIPSVETDNVLGCRLLMEYLCSINSKKLCVVSEPNTCRTLKIRMDSYISTIKEFGLRLDEEDIHIANHFYNKTNMGYDISYNILNKPLPDVICATTDNLAIGIMRRLIENGLSIPKDVALTGFDDISQCLFVTPNLTTISQPVEEITNHSARILLALMQKQRIDERHIVLKPKLVIRGSSMAPPVNTPD